MCRRDFFFGGRRAAARQSVQSVTVSLACRRAVYPTCQSHVFIFPYIMEGNCSILALKNAGSLVAVGIPALSDSDKKKKGKL